MHAPAFLLFASDATIAGVIGGLLLALALVAVLAERLRARRKSIDSVGWVPWTAVFLFCAFAGIAALTLAVKGWVAG